MDKKKDVRDDPLSVVTKGSGGVVSESSRQKGHRGEKNCILMVRDG